MTDRRYPTQAEIRRALKAAAETGRPITGYEVTPDGRIMVQVADAAAETPLDTWLREQAP